MQSLADLLRFFVGPPTPDTAASGWSTALPMPDATPVYPLAAGSFAPPDASALLLQNPDDLPAAFGPSYLPVPQLGMSTFQSLTPLQAPAPISNGGILGDHPTVTGGIAADSRAKGILQNFEDLGLWRRDNRSYQPVDPQISLPTGGDTPTLIDPLATGFLNRLRIPPRDSSFAWLGSNSGLRPQPSAEQFPWASQLGTPDDVLTRGTPSALPAPLVDNFFSPEFSHQSDVIPPEPAVPESQRDKNIHVYAQIHHPESSDWPSTAIDERRPSPSFDSGEQQNDWSPYLQRAQYVDPSAVTGNRQIDRITKLLIETLAKSAEAMGQGVPPGMRATVFGTRVHVDFGKRVKELDVLGIGQKGVEHNWSLEDFAHYGMAGTMRTDVVLKDRFGTPLAIYDVKTGNAQLTPKRIKELRDIVGAGDIPVIELRYRELTALQR